MTNEETTELVLDDGRCPRAYQDLLVICDNNLHQALILDALDYFTGVCVEKAMDLLKINDASLLPKQAFYVPMSYNDWRDWCGIKRHRLDTAMAMLAKRGFVRCLVKRFRPKNGRRYYEINFEAVNEAIRIAKADGRIVEGAWDPPKMSSEDIRDHLDGIFIRA